MNFALLLSLLAAAPMLVKADDGHPIAVWEKKPKGAPKGRIVLLHGRTWSAQPDFDLQVPGEKLSTMDLLVERGYVVDAIDLRGYGATKRDETGWWTPERAAADVVAVLKTFDGRVLLAGWSLGSLLTHLVAQTAPQKLRGVVLYGYGFDPDQPVGKPAPDPGEPAKKPNTAEAAAEDFITRGAITKKAIDAYVKAALAADPIKTDLKSVEQFRVLDAAKLTLPVLVLQGERDAYSNTPVLTKLWTKLGTPHRYWVTLEGTDHAAHLEHPSEWVNAVVAFDESISLPTTMKAP